MDITLFDTILLYTGGLLIPVGFIVIIPMMVNILTASIAYIEEIKTIKKLK